MAYNILTKEGTPIECVSGQLAGVWSGWKGLGDREIVREASAKGTHIDLAYKFLELRRHCSQEEAKNYFSNEVEIWVGELLEKKQIHRASHILKNVGKIPLDFIRIFAIKCTDPNLRNYLVQHVEQSFSTEEKEAWNTITLIAKYENKFNFQNNLVSHMCIEEFINLPQNIKDSVYAEIYLRYYEPDIVSYLKNYVIWDFLLCTNKFELVKFWIDLNYGISEILPNQEIRSDFLPLFTNLKINEQMIDSIESSNGMPIYKNLILNHLSLYGVFNTKEKGNAKSILSRLFSNCIIPSEFDKILSLPSCNVNREKFLAKIDLISFVKNYEDNCGDINTIDLETQILYDCIKKMCNAESNLNEHLIDGIIQTIKHISKNIFQYLTENPMIAFSIIFLYSNNQQNSKKMTMKEIFESNESFIIKDITLTRKILNNVIYSLPYLKSAVDPKHTKKKINMYDLLDGYYNLDSSICFKWRLNSEKMPDFSNEYLVKKYGHKEKLDYMNFLKEARPNMALKIFLKENSLGKISSETKLDISLCTHIFALRNIKSIDVVGGCISFMEIFGINSENLRLHIAAAQFVEKELNISIENSLELLIFNDGNELKLILNYLERAFDSRLNKKIISDKKKFIEDLKIWDLIVRFARAHCANLPTSLLEYLASQDAWFQFALVGDIFSYPLNQIMDSLQSFESLSIKEHLSLCFNNPYLSMLIDQEKKTKKVKKIRRRHSDQILTSKPSVHLKDSSQTLSLPNISYDIECATKISNVAMSLNTVPDNPYVNDLWLIILKCHQSQDPPGALLKASRTYGSPILTVLATCYEPSSVASYCYSWLVISIGIEDILKDYKECLEKQIWSASTVLNLFCNIVAKEFVTTLYRGFYIFLPENPLKSFFEFLDQCVVFGNFNESQKLISDFITECSNYKCNKMIDWDCDDASYLENLFWIQTIVIKSVIVTLGKALRGTQIRIEFLETMVQTDFKNKLIVDSPHFESLLEYTRILSETEVSLNYFCFDTTEKICESEAEIERCVDELIQLEDYNNALLLAAAANLNASKIVLAQYRSEFNKDANEDGVIKSDFWNRCASDFKKYEVCYEKAAEFFVEHAEKVKSFKDRYEILKLALEVLEENSTDRKICDTVEMAMWKSCILAGPENVEIKNQNNIFNKLKTELLSCVSGLRVTCSLTEPVEKIAVEVLIGRLLDAGRLDTALRVSKIFNFRIKDLQVLMLCLSLAEGEISPYQLTAQQRSLISDSPKRERNSTLRSMELKRMPSTSSFNLSLSSLNSNLEATSTTFVPEQDEQSDNLSLLSKLIDTLTHGVDIGIRILSYCQLSVQIGKSYHVLLKLKNPMNFLQEIVRSSYDRKFELARDIISSYQIENQEVANYLAEEIVAHITQVIEDDMNEPTAAWNYNMNLQNVIDLCKDSSLLGSKLLDMATKLLGASNGAKRNLVTLKISIELLIRSHDCFTASCDMEGIALILRKCQQLANSLQNLKHWSLLVRLVTGVGRFTEMNYIFKILKENDQFESLLGRGLDKVPGFKMALLEFLKRYCPEDKDLFNIVALHFRLYYEIALKWKNEAQNIIDELINEAKKECGWTTYAPTVEVKFTHNESTEKVLQLAMTNFTHATQYFLQDNKLNLANRCSHQAQLIALQIALFNLTSQNQQFPIILKLNGEEVNRAINRYLNFTQTLIIARAYDHHVDWASAIYTHCIINGETKYFKDFITSKRLSSSVAIDCSKRYRHEKNITKNMQDNMQTIISSLKDNECKYVLASQLGFKRMIEEMLEDSATAAYLKDTVFKKKYVASESYSESFS